MKRVILCVAVVAALATGVYFTTGSHRAQVFGDGSGGSKDSGSGGSKGSGSGSGSKDSPAVAGPLSIESLSEGKITYKVGAPDAGGSGSSSKDSGSGSKGSGGSTGSGSK